MVVQRVVMPVSESESWTVLGRDGSPIVPAESFLTYLAALERSPNTQRAYATSLKLWFEFLETVGVGWAEVSVDDVARFVSWLRAPAPNVIVLDGGTARRSPATVNRHLAAIFGFYEYHARCGVKVAAGLVSAGPQVDEHVVGIDVAVLGVHGVRVRDRMHQHRR